MTLIKTEIYPLCPMFSIDLNPKNIDAKLRFSNEMLQIMKNILNDISNILFTEEEDTYFQTKMINVINETKKSKDRGMQTNIINELFPDFYNYIYDILVNWLDALLDKKDYYDSLDEWKITLKYSVNIEEAAIKIYYRDNGAWINASKTNDKEGNEDYFWWEWLWEKEMKEKAIRYKRVSSKNGTCIILKFSLDTFYFYQLQQEMLNQSKIPLNY